MLRARAEVATLAPLAVAVLLVSWFPAALAVGADLTQPPTISSSDNVLSTALRLEETTLETPDYRMTTRALNGTLPGPTLLLRAGDTLKITFTNGLKDRGIPYTHNELSAPDESNLHFHGLFVSGELPSDDTTFVIRPGESYEYVTTLPAEHMPGTHWLHPHRHGSTSLQVGGGAASAIIVQDPPNSLPDQVSAAQDLLLFLQPLFPRQLRSVARLSGDTLFQVALNTSDGGGDGDNDDDEPVLLVNGQVRPVIRVDANEWLRLRFVHAGWRRAALRLSVDKCEMQLLAKDGLYIRDFPRSIRQARLPPGARADVMVRCASPETTYQLLDGGAVFATLRTSAVVQPSAALRAWSPVFPSYLGDLRDTPASAGCECRTSMGGRRVNGRVFDEQQVLHESYIGAVVQRDVRAGGHTYHQHVYAFQIVAGGADGEFVRVGDWHDTFDGEVTIRYQATKYVGKMMVHCHRLEHEDEGMMAIERVAAAGGDKTCVCATDPGTPPWVVPVAAIAGITAALIVIAAIISLLRRPWRKSRIADVGVDDEMPLD